MLLYGKAVLFKFTFLDDNVLILGRTSFLNNFANIIKSFQEPVFYLSAPMTTYYRPVLNVFFILQYKLFGNTYWGYHFFNILVHTVNILLVYKLFVRLKIDKKVSAISALLFAVHPVLTQAVAWVPGLNDLLLALFFLSSFLYLINYLETSNVKDLFFYLLFFALSIFTKESALPLIFIYFTYYLLSSGKKSIKKPLLIFIPSILVMSLFFYVRSKAIALDVTSGWLYNSVLNNFIGGFLVNLGKIFFPFHLSVLPILYKDSYLWGILTLILIGLIVILSKRRVIKSIILGFIIFIVTFLPTLINPAPSEKLVIFEHRLYIPLIGIFVIINSTSFFKDIFIKKKLYIPILILLFAMTFLHLDNFKNQDAFWKNAKATSGEFPQTKLNLALNYYSQGNLNEAKQELNDLLGQEDRYASMVYNNLAVISTREGNFDLAIEELKRAIKSDPLNSKSYLNLGYIYKYKKDIPKAKDYFLYAVYTDQDNVDAMMNLASIYLDEGNTERAQLIYNEVKKHGVEY